jgi:hypothetical protein
LPALTLLGEAAGAKRSWQSAVLEDFEWWKEEVPEIRVLELGAFIDWCFYCSFSM